MVATANPEDYTSRGRIITPLKDRYSAHIRTHYPQTREVEMEIVEQEARWKERGGRTVILPAFMREIVAEMTFQARESPDVNQVSGVSVRMSISNLESLVSNAEKRAIRCKESEIVPRISDLSALVTTTDGKLELEYSAAEKSQDTIVQKLAQKAVLAVFEERLEVDQLEYLVANFQEGWWVEVSDTMPASDYIGHLSKLKGLKPGIEKLNIGESPGEMAAAIEFILEGLHLNNKLNREILDGRVIYNETDKIQPLGRNPEMA